MAVGYGRERLMKDMDRLLLEILEYLIRQALRTVLHLSNGMGQFQKAY